MARVMDRPARLFRGPNNGEIFAVQSPTLEVTKGPSLHYAKYHAYDPNGALQDPLVKGRYELRIRHGEPVVLKDGNYAFDWQGWDKPPKPAKKPTSKMVGLKKLLETDNFYVEPPKKPVNIQGKKFTLKMVDDVYSTQAKKFQQEWLNDWHAELKAKYVKQITHSAPLFKDITSA